MRTPVGYRLPVPGVYAYAELELTAGGGVSTSAPRVVIPAWTVSAAEIAGVC